jgi:hypothetical protein
MGVARESIVVPSLEVELHARARQRDIYPTPDIPHSSVLRDRAKDLICRNEGRPKLAPPRIEYDSGRHSRLGELHSPAKPSASSEQAEGRSNPNRYFILGSTVMLYTRPFPSGTLTAFRALRVIPSSLE